MILSLWTSLATLTVVALAHWLRHCRELAETIERHPAGGSLFSFRARPCRHLLYAASLDEVPHVELLHVAHCEIAASLLPNQRGEAA